MPPWQGGGNMIADVTFERTVYQAAPERFEAGTGNIADAVGLGAAIDYIERIGIEAISRHEHELIEMHVAALGAIPGLRLIGAPRERAGVVSFVLDGCRSEDVGKALDERASRCVPAIIARSRSCAASVWRRRSGRLSRSTTPTRTSRRWSLPCAASPCGPTAVALKRSRRSRFPRP